MKAQGRTFSELVTEALTIELKDDDVKTLPQRLAERLKDLLRREGYQIHRAGSCLHVPADAPTSVRAAMAQLQEEPGGPMTREQMIAVGLEGKEQG